MHYIKTSYKNKKMWFEHWKHDYVVRKCLNPETLCVYIKGLEIAGP